MNSMQTEDVLLTVPEVAEILKTNVNYVYRLQKAGMLKFIKIGRMKCRRSNLNQFLEAFDGYDITNPEDIHELKGGEEDD